MSRQGFTIRYIYADMLGATWLTLRKQWLWKGVVRYVAILGAIFTAIVEIEADEHTLGMFAINVISGIILAAATLALTSLYWFWCVPRGVTKSYTQLSLDGGNVAFSYDDHQIEIADSTSTLKLPWDQWVKWTENKRLLLLYRTDLHAHYVPKEQVAPQQIEAIVANLDGAGVRKF